LALEPEVKVVGVAQQGDQAVHLAKELAPDLVALDAGSDPDTAQQAIGAIDQATAAAITVIVPKDPAALGQLDAYLESGAIDIAEFPDALLDVRPSELTKRKLGTLGKELLCKLKTAKRNGAFPKRDKPKAAQKILVAEDSAVDRRIIEHTLVQAGYQVVTAETGQAALQNVENSSPDLVILDYMLPDVDGITVLKALRDIDPDIFVIISTAHGSEKVAAAALREHADYYLIKPIMPGQLLNIVQKSLQQQEMRLNLQHLNKLHSQVLDRLPIGVFILSSDQRVQGWNRTMVAMTGLSAEAVSGRRFNERCPFFRHIQEHKILEALSPAEPQRIDELEATNMRGEKLVLSLQLCQLEMGAIVGVLQDITTKVIMREQLLEAERRATITRMVVTASHEINNPLTVVLSSVLFLQEDLAPIPGRVRKDLEMIQESVAQIQNVLYRMQELAEPAATRYLPGIEMYDLDGRLGCADEQDPKDSES
jgi:PAS domain S-box-containing protein